LGELKDLPGDIGSAHRRIGGALEVSSFASSFQTSSTISAIWLKASGLKERREVPSLAMKNLLASN
jgi:hypothetical protein